MGDGTHTGGRTIASASLLALVAIAALTLPLAAAAKPKASEPLYTISLSGTTHNEWTEKTEGVNEGAPPSGCKGQASETQHFEASAKFSAMTRPTPLANYGRRFRFFVFKAAVSSLKAGGSVTTAGSFSVDPNIPFPPEPSACAFTPKRTEAKCAFLHRAELEKGAVFWLSPSGFGNSKPFLLSQEEGMPVECNQPAISGIVLAGAPTRLKVGAAKALRKGHSLSDARTTTVPVIGYTGRNDGTETVSYKIVLKRVR
jgi:hypothetical protein